MTLVLRPLENIPLINPGDDLARIILESLRVTGIEVKKGDIFVLAQKIVSKAENRLVNLTTVDPSSRALKLGKITGKDPRLLELVLQESEEVLRIRPGLIIVEHRLGFICANAGIDHSNVRGPWGDHDDWVLLLPIAPDRTANMIRRQIEVATGKNIGLMIIDSHGRAWRMGTVGICIGLSGLPGVENLRGKRDLFNYQMQFTEVGIADELAGAASLLMGQINEATPVIHVRGFPYPLRDSSMQEIIRPKEKDLFR